MLDFHIIFDIESKESYCPGSHNYIGGIDYNEFDYWQINQVLDDKLDFFSDFRLTQGEVINCLNKLNAVNQADLKSVDLKLGTIIKKAADQGAGLIAYCD